MYQIRLLETRKKISTASQEFLDAYDGNVDLLNRPLVPGSKMSAAGWTNVPSDDIATVYSSTFSAGNRSYGYDYAYTQNVIIDLTPIKADGTVLSPSALEAYVDTVITAASANSRTLMQEDALRNKLFLRVADVAQGGSSGLENALAEAEIWTTALHDQQEEYYLQFKQTTIYDQSSMDELSTFGPKCNLELNGPGTLTFTLPCTHELIDEIKPLQSYIRALDDGTEIFFGRVSSQSDPKITGHVSFTCDGALSFLNDSEVPPDAKNNSGQSQSRKMKAKDFFTWCINQHNAEVVDPRRQFVIGTISASKKEEEANYSITSYTQTKSALESNILNVYGGFLRIRSANGGNTHYIDWVQDYGSTNPQGITLGENIVDQMNEIDANSMFTVMRPVGNNGITLTEKTIDLYSESDMNKYGRIVKTIEFKAASNESELRTAANKYKNSFNSTLFGSSSIQLVDMHYIDGTSPKVRIGDRFTHIAGYEGKDMIAATMELDFENPQNDRMELKNRKSLDPDATDNGHGTNNKMSRASRGASQMALKYIHELEDKVLIDVSNLEIRVQDLDIYAKGKIEEHAGMFVNLSSAVDNLEELYPPFKEKLDDLEYDVQTVLGTEVIQNSSMIATLAGQFNVYTDGQGNVLVNLIQGTQFTISDNNGGQLNVAETVKETKDKVDGKWQFIQDIEGSALWTQRDKITGVVGNYKIVKTQDPDHPGQYIEKLVIQSGGGMAIERDGVQYGLFDSGNLTGGLMARRINNQTETQIAGNRVLIGNIGQQSGKTADDWFTDAMKHEGVFADYMVVRRLTAGEITTMLANIENADIGDINCDDIGCGTINAEIITVSEGMTTDTLDAATIDTDELFINDTKVLVANVTKSSDGKTLTVTKTDGSSFTFNKAASGGKVNGVWSGNALTVSIGETGEDQYVQRVESRFGYDSSSQRNYIESFRYATSATPGNTYSIANTKIEYKLGLSSDKKSVGLQYISGSTIANTPSLSIPLQTKTFKSVGTFTPDSNYSGFGQITISDLVKPDDVKPAFIKLNGEYFVTTYHVKSGGNVYKNNTAFSLKLSGTKVVVDTAASPKETPSFTIPLQAKTISEPLDDYLTPDTGYVGFSKVKTSGLIKASSVLVHFKKDTSTGQYWIYAYRQTGTNPDGSAIYTDIKTKEIKMILDGNTVKITNASGTVLGGAPKLSVAQRYKDGWAACRASVVGKTYVISSKTYDYTPTTEVAADDRQQFIRVAVPNETSDGTLLARSYYVTSDNNVAYIRYGSASGKIVAKLTHSKYNNGWAAAREKVSYPSSSPSTLYNSMSITIPAKSVGSSSTYAYYVTADSNYVYIRYNSASGAVVARANNVAQSTPSASDILIGNTQFSTSQPGGISSYTSLDSVTSLLRDSNNKRGYIYFKTTISGGTGEKWYRFATPT